MNSSSLRPLAYIKDGGNVKVLVSAIHYPVASGRYILEALRNIGVEAYSDGPSTGNVVWGTSYPRADPWLPDVPEDFHPDLVIVADSDNLILDSSRQFKEHCPIVVYGVDNHVRYYRRPWIEHYYVGHYAPSIHKYAEDTTWLPCATSTSYKRSAIPWGERKFDVALVGMPYPHRVRAIEALQRENITVFAAVGLFADDFALAYHNARIALSISAKGDLAQRVFETAALGNVVLSDDVEDLKKIGRGPVFTFSDERDMVEKAKSLLEMSTETAEDHIGHSVAWASAHTWEERVKRILEDYKYEPQPRLR